MDLLGRRTTLLLLEVPLIAGWLLIAFAGGVPQIYAGRLLVGLGSGLVGAPARVYTGEVNTHFLLAENFSWMVSNHKEGLFVDLFKSFNLYNLYRFYCNFFILS